MDRNLVLDVLGLLAMVLWIPSNHWMTIPWVKSPQRCHSDITTMSLALISWFHLRAAKCCKVLKKLGMFHELLHPGQKVIHICSRLRCKPPCRYIHASYVCVYIYMHISTYLYMYISYRCSQLQLFRSTNCLINLNSHNVFWWSAKSLLFVCSKYCCLAHLSNFTCY